VTDLRDGAHDYADVTDGANARWSYRAANAEGAAVRGEIEASSERAAIDALRRRSLWVVELSPVRRADGRSVSDGQRIVGERWQRLVRHDSDTELAVVVRSIATLLSAGVPLVRTLAYAAQDAGRPSLRAGFRALHDALQGGSSLSVAVAAQTQFPPIFPPLIAAGESTGTLATSLAMLADHLEQRDALRARLRSALIYPSILAVASIVGVTVILLVVVPRFAALITDGGGALPLSTRALIAVSVLLSRGWWVWLLVLVGMALLLPRLRRDAEARRRIDAWALALPMVGALVRTQAAAGYTGTLAIALRAGVSLPAAMGLARAVVRNRVLQEALRDAETRVMSGATLSRALAGLLSPMAERLIDAGEASGDVAGMAARAAEASDALLQRTVTRAVALVEPLMILGFGGVVGFVALALLQAIYGLNASVL